MMENTTSVFFPPGSFPLPTLSVLAECAVFTELNAALDSPGAVVITYLRRISDLGPAAANILGGDRKPGDKPR